MSEGPTRGYRSLRYGRSSEAGFNYFITFCCADRKPGLHRMTIATALRSECQAMQVEGVWKVRCATIMPDHMHLLITLGTKLPLGKAVARLKARTAPVLRDASIAWQAGYFDHRVRPQEDILPYFLYIYLNPYRADLIPTTEAWPWLICEAADREWFLPMLDRGLPEPEWLVGLP